MHFDEMLMQARANRGCPDEHPWVRVSGGDDATAAVREALEKSLRESGMEVRLFRTGSLGWGDFEPLMTVHRPGGPEVIYGGVNPSEVSELAIDLLRSGKARADRALCTKGGGRLDNIPRAEDLPFFKLQNRVALRNCGLIDPEDVDDYVACAGGYAGLSKASQMDQTAVLEMIRDSSSDNGKGCSLPDQLKVLAEAQSDEKYLVCNGIEGDPRASVSTLLLESDPHAVLEGMLIAAHAARTGRLIVCVNAAQPEIATRVGKAIEEMESKGLVGNNVLDSSFSCSVKVRGVQPSLVAEEETALLRFLEGKQAMPLIRPENEGLKLLGKPGIVLLPEALSKISAVFRETGTEGNTVAATRVVSLSGDIGHPCVVEVPGDTTIRTLVDEIGGGVAPGRTIKAVGIGTPMGKLLGSADLETPVASGSVDGSITIEVFDSERCSVELARDHMALLRKETCGKCVFCREGILQMADILDSIAAGEGTKDDLDLLGTLGKAMETGSICFVGKTAAAPVLGGLELFRHEYEAHVKDKRCPMLKRETTVQV
jgi:NADH:ubiquinone oxidoreductase subunit F (NADH-binding)/(2Fe-2S) ferredoxin